MYCSTCGAKISPGRTDCERCGAHAPLLSPGRGTDGVVTVATCPRCGYRGEGIGYFSRGVHVAGLVMLTLMTAGLMGAGGILYYLARRKHRVCARCGANWGPHGERAAAPRAETVSGDGVRSSGGGEGLHLLAVGLFVIGAIIAVAGIAEAEIGAVLTSLFLLLGGALTLRASRTRREARRARLVSALQLPVLRLAAERGGRLTVTEVSAALGWPLPRAEKVLHSLDDGLRVDSEVTDEGVIVYEFREIRSSLPSSRRDPER